MKKKVEGVNSLSLYDTTKVNTLIILTKYVLNFPVNPSFFNTTLNLQRIPCIGVALFMLTPVYLIIFTWQPSKFSTYTTVNSLTWLILARNSSLV